MADKQKVELTGKLKLKHKLALSAIGQLFIWIGNALQQVNTYEDLKVLGDMAEQKIDEIEEEHGEELEHISDTMQGKRLQESN